MKILGLSFFYHDSAACLLVDGVPLAMAEEERFSREKHDSGWPQLAVDFVLAQGEISEQELDWVVFYEKPFLKFVRVMKSSLAAFPLAPAVFIRSIRNLFLDKIWIRHLISEKLRIDPAKILFSNHHLSHAASAFFCSPYEKAAILTVDGVGEWATTTLGVGEGNKINVLEEINFPNSLGLFYSAFTAFLGFEVNEGEYKVMGMAPYGRPKYTAEVKKTIELAGDGSYKLNMDYFIFDKSLERTYSQKFVQLFGASRDPASKFFTRATGWPTYFGPKPQGEEYERLAKEQEHYADLAASLQAVFEEAVTGLAKRLHRLTGLEKLCLAGGGGLNSVANWQIAQRTPFKEIFVQPAAGDGGGALGAALAVYHLALGQERKYQLKHAYYGQSYSASEIRDFLETKKIKYELVKDEKNLIEKTIGYLLAGKVIGWFQGRFEWGPRALGNRSILADARRPEMKDRVNTKIKFREPYRPFAPSVLAEEAEKIFMLPDAPKQWPARFMLYVVPVKKEKQNIVPAITHVDGSARPQLVFKAESPRYWELINNFFEKTGVPLLMNTSFNLKGEPIVNTPEDAVSTLARSGLDALVMENFIVQRSDLPAELIEQYARQKVQTPKEKKSRQWLKKIGILLISAIFTLALLEIGIRLFTKPVYPILRTDAQVGTIHQKNYKGNIWNDESQSSPYIITNSLGYIGGDYPVQKLDNVWRLAMLGDSFTEGLQVDYFKGFTYLLEKSLNVSQICPARSTQVMNYGVGGSGTFLEYQTYKKNVALFKPDVVAVMFFINDYSDNLNKINFDPENYQGSTERNIWLKSFLLNFQLPKYIFGKLQGNVWFKEMLSKFGLYEFNDYAKQAALGTQPIAQSKEYYDYTFSILDKFNRAAQNNGSKFMVFILPSEDEFSSQGAWQKIPEITKLEDFLKSKNIISYDLAPELFAAKNKLGTCLTFGCAGHFTEQGHVVMASILQDYLSKNIFSGSKFCSGAGK